MPEYYERKDWTGRAVDTLVDLPLTADYGEIYTVIDIESQYMYTDDAGGPGIPGWEVISATSAVGDMKTVNYVLPGGLGVVLESQYSQDSDKWDALHAPANSAGYLKNDGAGALSWNNPAVSLSDDIATNHVEYPTWVTATAGTVSTLYTSSTKLMFNPSTGVLTASGFSGNVTGDVTGNAGTVTNGVYTNGSYANPAWITSLDPSKITPSLTDLGNGGLAKTVDWSVGLVQKITLNDANCTLTFSNPTAGGRYALLLVQDGTGSRLVTWPIGVMRWANNTPPVLTTAINRIDLILFLYDGTSYLGSYVYNY